VAVSSNLPAIKSTLDRDLRTWTDRVRDTLNATGDDRLVRLGELERALESIEKKIVERITGLPYTQVSTTAGGGGGFNSLVNNYGLPNGLVSDLYDQIEQEILNSALVKELITPFLDDLLRRLEDYRKRMDEHRERMEEALTNARSRLTDARSRMDDIRNEFEAKLVYQEADYRGAVYQEYIARRDGDAVLTQSIELLDAQVEDNAAAILTERTARVTADEALANTISLLDTRVGDNTSAILTEQTARATADSALASQINLLDTRVGNNTSAILTEQTARTTADSALATQINLLDTRVGNNAAAISGEQTARVTADEALAEDISLLDTRVGSNAAAIYKEQTARVTANEALAEDISLLDTRVGSTEASIIDEQTARATEDSALSESISSNYTTQNGRVAAVEVKAESIDGVFAQYTVKLNVNNHVAGIGLMNDGNTSAFVVQADRFAVVSSSGTGYKAPFFVDDGQTFIDTALIKDASITNAKIGTAQIGTLTLAGEAVTIPRYASFSSYFTTTTTWSSAVAPVTVTVGADVGWVNFVVVATAQLYPTTSSTTTGYLGVFVNGTMVTYYGATWSGLGISMAASVMVGLGAGTHTIDIRWKSDASKTNSITGGLLVLGAKR